PYVFAEVNRLKAQARADGVDVIDFGMGNPDMDTPKHIVEKLIETVQRPRTHRYSASKGIAGLRRAQAAYYERRFGVGLNPETEVIATLGSKEGLANLAMAITAPGDVMLAPNPSYPIHPYGFMIAGGTLRHIPALHEGRFDPDAYMRALERAVKHSVPSPIGLVVNFPSNPTAQVCDLDFYAGLVRFAKEHHMVILSDLAYAEIYFDDNPPPSILQVEGAKDVAVEFTSLSKTYSMPGWRMGFAVGNDRLIGALTRIKSYLDYGAFTPIQVAASAALNGPQECIEEIRGVYKSRRDTLVDAMGRAGWDIPPPPATMFAWAPVPEPFRALGSMEFAKILLTEAEVAVSPGVGFGEYGEGFVRIGLVENEQRIRQAARSVKKLIQNADEILGRYTQLAG
ncbi:MAG: LL-diaminopimelate aminotransferase, partial [Pseudomonadota bacterium]